MINHEQLLSKFIELLYDLQYEHFLEDCNQTSKFSNEEWDELKRLSDFNYIL